MRRFSIGTALGDTFGLMARRPLSVLVWGLLMVAPVIATMAMMLPAMGTMAGWEADAPDAVMPPEFMAHMMQFQLASTFANLVQLVLMAVIYAAVFRAVLRPSEKSWFSLRLGMDELRVAVAGLAIGVGLYVLIILLVFVGIGVGFALWGARAEPGPMAALFILLVLVALVGVGWGLSRVSLIAPASVLYRDFAFAQGWRLASRQAWPLFGMMILIVLIILLMEIVLVLAAVAVLFATVGTAGSDWMTSAAADNPFPLIHAWLEANWYWVAIGGVLLSAAYGVLMTLTIAPYASACRQLAASDPTSEASPAPVA